jgi:hypothetical protein
MNIRCCSDMSTVFLFPISKRCRSLVVEFHSALIAGTLDVSVATATTFRATLITLQGSSIRYYAIIYCGCPVHAAKVGNPP